MTVGWRVRILGIASLVGCVVATWAGGAEVNYVSFYPATASAGIVQTRTLRVGSALAPFVPSDDQAGLVLIDQALGIGPNAPEASLDVRAGVYFEGGNGDVDGDGGIDRADLLLMKNFLWEPNAEERFGFSASPPAPLTPGEYARADVNGDGIVSWLDHRMLERIPTVGLAEPEAQLSLAEAQREGKWLQATAMSIDLSGNVGIGTLSPEASLHVEDQVNSSNVDLVTMTKVTHEVGDQHWDFQYGSPDAGQLYARMTVTALDNRAFQEKGGVSFSLVRQGALNKVLEMSVEGVKMGDWENEHWQSVPNGVETGNLDVNDAYVRSAGKWLSQILTTASASSASAAKVYRFQGNGNDPVEMPKPVFLFGWRNFADGGTLISWNNSPFSKLPEAVIVKAEGQPYWTAGQVESDSSIRAFGKNSNGFFLVVGEGK